MSNRHATDSFPFSQLRKWYEKHQRALLWRQDPNPYSVWIAEVMSQQTTIRGFEDHYQKWFLKFPNLSILAKASEADLLEAWQGLGYYSRVRNLQKAAIQLLEKIKKDGDWPKVACEWQELPGIGPYTSAAISSLCFGEPVIAVDGNVIRVLSRWAGISDYYGSKIDKVRFAEKLRWLEASLPKQDRFHFNQSLMDLGALVCRPLAHQSDCLHCPLQKNCEAFKHSSLDKIPKAKKRPPTISIELAALAYRNSKGLWLCRKIPKGQRLEGQWEVPTTGFHKDFYKVFEVKGPLTHSITRYRYKVYLLNLGDWKGKTPPQHSFLEAKDPRLTHLSRKLLKLFY